MPEITRVQTEADYEAALARIDELIHSVPGSEEDAELDRISDLVIQYEDEHYPIEKPEPAPALEFLLDQEMVSRDQMVALAGDGANVDAILAGNEPIPSGLAELLRKEMGIVVDDLTQFGSEM
ncbi:MAG: hypothetical protein J4G13_08495 [Dehalococcoidia bacterium]|nr:hypothetical protein [Dehalococcoidia bacterium]